MYSMKPLVVLITVFAFMGCATTSKKVEPQIPDPQYLKLKAEINERFDELYFHPGDPMVVDQMDQPAFRLEFAKLNCGFVLGKDNPSPEKLYRCDELFQRTLLNRIAAKYFAVDRSQIELKCARDPLICGDPGALEYYFRQQHDSVIDRVRAQKLEPLEMWRQGKINEAELNEILNRTH